MFPNVQITYSIISNFGDSSSATSNGTAPDCTIMLTYSDAPEQMFVITQTASN